MSSQNGVVAVMAVRRQSSMPAFELVQRGASSGAVEDGRLLGAGEALIAAIQGWVRGRVADRRHARALRAALRATRLRLLGVPAGAAA
jgi:hypothetical protein